MDELYHTTPNRYDNCGHDFELYGAYNNIIGLYPDMIILFFFLFFWLDQIFFLTLAKFQKSVT